MRRADEGGMEEGTTGLRGVAISRGGVTPASKRVDGESTISRRGRRRRARAGSKEAVSGEGVAVAPRPPQESVSYPVGGACSRQREAIERVLAAPVRILVFTPADEMGVRAQVKKSSMGRSEIWTGSVNMCA